MPEEESFAVLVKIMQDYRMREMFKPSMAELGEWRQCRPCLQSLSKCPSCAGLCMYQLDTLIQEHIPDLYVHFQVGGQ